MWATKFHTHTKQHTCISAVKYWRPQQTAWGRQCFCVEHSIGSPRLNGTILWIWPHGSRMSWWKDVSLNSGSCPKAGYELEMLEGIWLCYHRLRPANQPPPPQKKTLKPYILFVIISFGPKANEVINYLLNPQWMVLLQTVHNFSACQGMPIILPFTLPLLQDPANYPYPEQHYSGPSPPDLRSILIFSPIYALVFLVVYPFEFSHQKFSMQFCLHMSR